MAAQDLQLPFEFPPTGQLSPAQVQANFDFLLKFFKGKFQIDDTTGAITTPLQPYFYASTASISGTNRTGDLLPYPFDSQIQDVGGWYNPSTYTATVPEDGIYLFSANVLFQPNGASPITAMRMSVGSSYTIKQNLTTSDLMTMVCVSVLPLNAGDNISVSIEVIPSGTGTWRTEPLPAVGTYLTTGNSFFFGAKIA